MTGVSIRSAEERDIPRLYEISCEAHRISYDNLIPRLYRRKFLADFTPTPAGLAKRKRLYGPKLTDSAWTVVVAEQGGKVVGYAQSVARRGEVKIAGLFIDPAAQGRGIGAALLERLLAGLPPGIMVRLSVLQHNDRAIRLYERYGFTLKGYDIRRFYGARQRRMVLTLT